ncbi:hypothetical protein D9M70_415620 [compost metagenome]
MHRFLDVCLAVQQDRDLAATLHSDLPLPTPELVDEEVEDDIVVIDAAPGESEEDALARAIAEEQALLEADA